MSYRQPFRNEWPITQKYGETITSSFHTGIDYGCPLDTPILASADGRVMFAGWDNTGYGNMVIVQHASDRATLYAHLSSIYVKVGENVCQGALLGHSGSTGNSTGPHLHFEVRTQWDNYRTHFDPMLLPLISVDDAISFKQPTESAPQTIMQEPKPLEPGPVMVTAPLGVFVHNQDFTSKQVLPYGTKLTFTGKTTEKDGLTFCECAVWIAESDGDTTILTPET